MSARNTKNPAAAPDGRALRDPLDLELDLGLRELDLLADQNRRVLGDAGDEIAERTGRRRCTAVRTVSTQVASRAARAGSRPRARRPGHLGSRRAGSSGRRSRRSRSPKRPCVVGWRLMISLACAGRKSRSFRRVLVEDPAPDDRRDAVGGDAAIAPMPRAGRSTSASSPFPSPCPRAEVNQRQGTIIRPIVCPFSRAGKRMPRRNRPRRGTEARRGAAGEGRTEE